MAHKRHCRSHAEWPQAFAKDPEDEELLLDDGGARLSEIDLFYRWVGDEEDHFTTTLANANADDWMNALANSDNSRSYNVGLQTAVKSLFDGSITHMAASCGSRTSPSPTRPRTGGRRTCWSGTSGARSTSAAWRFSVPYRYSKSSTCAIAAAIPRNTSYPWNDPSCLPQRPRTSDCDEDDVRGCRTSHPRTVVGRVLLLVRAILRTNLGLN